MITFLFEAFSDNSPLLLSLNTILIPEQSPGVVVGEDVEGEDVVGEDVVGEDVVHSTHSATVY